MVRRPHDGADDAESRRSSRKFVDAHSRSRTTRPNDKNCVFPAVRSENLPPNTETACHLQKDRYPRRNARDSDFHGFLGATWNTALCAPTRKVKQTGAGRGERRPA
ncbi:UNVERIFIED_CONTAM: hypothetical protein HHA_451610 [Hammondia hammondi]|eukprot:XP_008884449.1 hypothetical protein HHA_451610 [Hammondia hammondi]